jgi:nucleoside-diphosphate-sugar epimerase
MGLSPSLSRSALLQSIWATVPAGTLEPIDSKVLAKLSELTSDLIDISGRNSLKIDPFSEVYQRRVAIDLPKVSTSLTDKVVLITGGQGFVGTNLIAKLQEFGVKKIVSVDISADRSQRVAIAVATARAPEVSSGKKRMRSLGEVSSPRELLVGSPTNCTKQRDKTDGKPFETTASDPNIPVTYYYGDVRDSRSLQAIFDIEQPQIVFHLAAERLPGLAEIQIHQTVSTNILGCDNIIKLCEANRVEACIFSSTGKASRYYTPDIYAASKKIAEWLFSDYSQPKNCQYGIVRFTHVVENSPVSADLDERVANGIVSMHAPDRYIYTQNIEETIGLLLNALTILEPGRTKLLAVKDLGWPINTLDLALHKIVRSGRDIPLYFKGLPAGYERHVFLGQLDLSGKKATLPMLNVLEADNSEISPAGDTVISQIVPFDDRVLARCLTNINRAIVSTDTAIKQTVIAGEKEVALSSFVLADAARLADIITWGTNHQEMSAAGVDIHYHRDTLELLTRGMSSTKVTIAPGEVTTTESIPLTIPVPTENIDRDRVKKFARVKQHIDLVQKRA